MSNVIDGGKFMTKINGKRVFTALFGALLTIELTDLLFALDSIPAIFGITTDPFIVFTANVFALMGLRQLYFLLSGLMERLKYLAIGLSIILGWIGVKLVIHALHKNDLPFINNGNYVTNVPEISTELSLGVIVSTLIITTIVSLIATSKDEKKPRKSESVKKAAAKKSPSKKR